MAIQVVQINVSQSSSGAPIAVSWSWTSDAFPVRNARSYLRQQGGYTMDRTLIDDVVDQVVTVVKTTLRTDQLF
jgi:hypothetical protein